MSAAGYWWRAFAGRSWRAALATAVVGGLLGAVALGAVAGARRTATAYGAPLGIAAGSWAWTSFAGSLGVVPVTVVSVSGIALGFAALLVTGNLLAAMPAAVAASTPPAATLRTE